MKRFPLLIAIAAVVVWLFPVVGPFAGPAGAAAITTGDVDPGGAGTQPNSWFVIGDLYVGKSGRFGALNVPSGPVAWIKHGVTRRGSWRLVQAASTTTALSMPSSLKSPDRSVVKTRS